MKIRMRNIAVIAIAVVATTILAFGGGLRRLAVWSGVIRPGLESNGKSTVLPNGWRITPAGRHIALTGDMVMKIIPGLDGKTALVSTAGWHDHSVNTIDLQSERVVENINVGKIWTGMASDPATGAIFVSAGGAPSQQFLNGGEGKGNTAAKIKGLEQTGFGVERQKGA